MGAQAWLVCLLLLLEACCQRTPQTGAISSSEEDDFLLRETALLPDKISDQHNPDVHFIWSQPGAQARPYSLSLSPDDYKHNLPKPKRPRAARLMKLLGSSYNPFWMSLKDPRGLNTSLKEAGILSQDLAKHTTRFQKKLLQQSKGLDLSKLLPVEDGISFKQSQTFLRCFRQWLADRATCHLTSSWVDMGPIFWPRWVRHTACDQTQVACSWPPGMSCQPAQVTQIKLLAWHCWASKDHVWSPGKSPQQCTWRQVPYPVVASCKCAC